MAAIGDAEGTVSIMQLCKPLYETTSKEKEIMQQIFEREFRREKNLEVMKRLANEAKNAPKKGGKEEDPAKVQADREAKLKADIEDIQDNFFKHVATEEHDAAAIKARGELNQQAHEAANDSPSAAAQK
jgi:dynein intermediate chain 2, axonemal